MKYISSITLLIFTTCTFAMHLEYPLSDEATITKRLWDAGFSNFAKESEMGANLGNKCMGPITLWGEVSEILKQYKNNYPFIIAAWDRNSIIPYPPAVPNESELMRILLQDYPRAIEALENNQWIERDEKIIEKYRRNSWNKKLSSFAPCINK